MLTKDECSTESIEIYKLVVVMDSDLFYILLNTEKKYDDLSFESYTGSLNYNGYIYKIKIEFSNCWNAFVKIINIIYKVQLRLTKWLL